MKNARTCVFVLVVETCFSELFLIRKVILSNFGRELRGYGIRTWPRYQSQTRTKTVLRTRVRETTLILSPRPTTMIYIHQKYHRYKVVARSEPLMMPIEQNEWQKSLQLGVLSILIWSWSGLTRARLRINRRWIIGVVGEDEKYFSTKDLIFEKYRPRPFQQNKN